VRRNVRTELAAARGIFCSRSWRRGEGSDEWRRMMMLWCQVVAMKVMAMAVVRRLIAKVSISGVCFLKIRVRAIWARVKRAMSVRRSQRLEWKSVAEIPSLKDGREIVEGAELFLPCDAVEA
jgi:hypothetical protein